MAGPGAAEAELPATVAAAWGVRERSQKGPKPALSLARIVDAGVRVADSEGLDAVSMGRVAASLDTAPMSLYRHVSSKDELVRLMVDAAWGDSPGPAPAGEDWRAGLSRWAWGFRAALRRHPWAGRIPISGLPIMPREIAWFEDALACLAGTGLTEARKASVIMLLSGYVRNLAATEADIAAAVAASGLGVDEWMASYPRMLGQLTDPRRFPALTAFIAAGVFDTADSPDEEFIFGLGRILDGVGVLIGELQGEAVGDEVDVADLPVAGGLAEVAAAFVEVLGGVHAGLGAQDHGGQALVAGQGLAGGHEEVGDAMAAGRLVDGEHPDLGLVGAAQVGERGSGQGQGDGAGDRAVRAGDQDDAVADAGAAVAQDLGVGVATEAAVPVGPLSQRSDQVGFGGVGAADRYVGGHASPARAGPGGAGPGPRRCSRRAG
ncbi:MAG TPA: TetR/AcrR family transcriptional regulator [Streptosporangiaceae bacterium]